MPQAHQRRLWRSISCEDSDEAGRTRLPNGSPELGSDPCCWPVRIAADWATWAYLAAAEVELGLSGIFGWGNCFCQRVHRCARFEPRVSEQ